MARLTRSLYVPSTISVLEEVEIMSRIHPVAQVESFASRSQFSNVESYDPLEEGTRHWLEYAERKIEFSFPPIAHIAHSQISHL